VTTKAKGFTLARVWIMTGGLVCVPGTAADAQAGSERGWCKPW
jgi:hypothetical protein